MWLSDISIKRPVFATVISLLLIAFGVLSFSRLPVRELPDIDRPIVSVSTEYRGASASVVDSRITQVIESVISGIEGIQTISSSSVDGSSSVRVEFNLTRDIEAAANDVRNAVGRVAEDLPEGTRLPEVRKAESDGRPFVWWNLTSTTMDGRRLTDYAERVLVDQLSSVNGVARIFVGGGQTQAMRIWLDREALAARELTVNDIEAALRRENVELPAGTVESLQRDFPVRVIREYQTAEDFAQLVISQGAGGHLIRLAEVARVELGSVERRIYFKRNGEFVVGLGAVKISTANALDVAKGVEDAIERIRPSLPAGTDILPSSDSTIFIQESIDEVYRTLLIAGLLVVAVIYLFLGNVRAALVPAVTVPVSLIATFTVLSLAGLSINLLTLLAMVLAIGIVVDDSIVVLENIQRRVDEGEPPLVAAFRGARQVGFAVIATTLVLIAVFVPIMFLTDDIGRLFGELAVTIATAVGFSSIVALSLSAMLCSKLLRPNESSGALVRGVDAIVGTARGLYISALERAYDWRLATGAVVLLVVGGIYGLFQVVPAELAPDEDRGNFNVGFQGPEGQSFALSVEQAQQVEDILMSYIESGEAVRLLVRVPGGFGGGASFDSGWASLMLDHWDNRARSGQEIVREINGKLQELPAVRGRAFMRQGFRGSGGPAVEFVIGGPDYETLSEWKEIFLEEARAYPGITNIDADLQETKPQLHVDIDRQRAADLGVSVEAIGRTLETQMGGRRVGTFLDRGEEYDVILQGELSDRRGIEDLTNLYVRSERTGAQIPLLNLVNTKVVAGPSSLNRFNRMRAVTFSASIAEGYTLGQVLSDLERIVQEKLPAEARTDYKGQAAELIESGNALAFTFGLALLVVFLVLAAQFESFIHPFVIMLTVPLAVGGALFALYMSDGTLNIYSRIGIIILIGLAAKNGILIVEFANQLRDEGRAIRDAVLEAASVRFRPVIMTGLSTALGSLPLVLADGAGAASRQTIGLVILTGVSFATLLTLFVVPVFYGALARFTKPPRHVTQQLEAWDRRTPDRGAAGGVSAAE